MPATPAEKKEGENLLIARTIAVLRRGPHREKEKEGLPPVRGKRHLDDFTRKRD